MLAGSAAIAALLVAGPASAKSWWNPWSRQDAAAPARTVEAGNGFAVAQSGGPADASRIDRLEAQMRTMTGQIEELTHQLQQLQAQIARMQNDNEFRFGALERAIPGGHPAPARPRAEAPSTSGNASAGTAGSGVTILGNDNASADAGGGTQLGTPPHPLGQLTLDAPPNQGGQPLDLSSLARGNNSGGIGSGDTGAGAANGGGAGGGQVASLTGDSRSDYERAYQYVLSGDYDLAEASFRQFLSAYPKDARAPDAQYWLGESLFARGKYRDSADAFLAGYKAYPRSSKAPDTLLKLGLSLAGLGERQAACSTYAQVLKQYPSVSNALRQRVLTEQASANC